MKKIIYLLILVSLFAVGCGKDDTTTNNQTENIQDEDNNGISDENGDASNGGETSNNADDNDASGGDGSTKVDEIPFDLQIELSEGTTVGDFIPSATVDGTTGWLLENSNYVPQREYLDLQDEMLFTKTACGWIENHPDDGSYLEDGGPVLNSELFVERKNGKDVKCGYFSEVTFRVFSMETIREHTLRPEERTIDYWCIVYKKEATEFTWIFLDKAFFTEEEAMTVAESLPETELKTTIKLKTGYSIQVDPLEGYVVSYNIEYPESTPFYFKSIETEEAFGLNRETLSGKIYQEVMETDSLDDWGLLFRSSTKFVIYISGNVGVSVYQYTHDVPMGDVESGDIPDDLEGYLVVWGHRDSEYVYVMWFPVYMELDEVERIVKTIHIEFEKTE